MERRGSGMKKIIGESTNPTHGNAPFSFHP